MSENQSNQVPGWVSVLLLALLFGGWYFAVRPYMSSGSSNAPTPTTASNDLLTGVAITKPGYLVATTEADLSEAVGYAVQGDNAALQQMVSQGRVAPLKEGLRVYREGCAGTLCSFAKIRPEGQTQTFFTSIEAIGK